MKKLLEKAITRYRVTTFHYHPYTKGGFLSREEARKFGLSLWQPFTISVSN
jgi:hypothetical protein